MSAVIATLVAAVVAMLMAGLGSHSTRQAPVREPAHASADPVIRRPTIFGIRRTSDSVRPASVAAWADDLARAIRHGSTLHSALTNTLPSDPVVRRRSAPLRHWLDRGATVSEACDEWSDEMADHTVAGSRRRTELLAIMGAVIAAAATLGGAAAAPLNRVAVTMRQHASDDLERDAHSAQAKMSAKVLTSIPLAVLGLLLLTDANVRAVVTSPAGGGAVGLGVTLNALGVLWMRRIVGPGSGAGPC